MEKLFFEILNFMTFGALNKKSNNLLRDEDVVLYFFPSCPYCGPVINAFNKKKVMVEARNIQANINFHKELAEGGGQAAVPCLRIRNSDGTFEWLYDSNKIISFINNRY